MPISNCDRCGRIELGEETSKFRPSWCDILVSVHREQKRCPGREFVLVQFHEFEVCKVYETSAPEARAALLLLQHKTIAVGSLRPKTVIAVGATAWATEEVARGVIQLTKSGFPIDAHWPRQEGPDIGGYIWPGLLGGPYVRAPKNDAERLAHRAAFYQFLRDTEGSNV